MHDDHDDDIKGIWTRRAFLKSGGIAVFSLGVGGNPLFINRAVMNSQNHLFRDKKILVTIFQRGAMDGLMAVPKLNDRYLIDARPRLYMDPGLNNDSVMDLDNGFGFHPSLITLMDYWKEGSLAVVHGMGSPNKTRSHFDAQDFMESGTPGDKGTSSGWLNRAVGLMGHESPTPFQSVALTPSLPRSLYGDESALAISDLDNFGLPSYINLGNIVGNTFESLYEDTTKEILKDTANATFEAVDLLEKIRETDYVAKSKVPYPNSKLGNSLKQIAQLIKADVGLEVAFAETGGWDTHVQQGTSQGSFANNLKDLSDSIAAFWKDLGSYQDRVNLMTMTEFGRTVKENGTGGTDHGRGSCLFVLGKDVDGGKVHGNVPDLVKDNLEDGRDLPVTTDFRAIFSEVTESTFGIKNDKELFPGWEGKKIKLFKN
tara:strand:- start:2757 stop:4043 length:1287 start_codon:yes stop_codon:yes gene_type:complete